MNSEMKPCPFCGGEAEYHFRNDESGWVNQHWVYCDDENCLASVGLSETKQEAIDGWNTRADTAALTAAQEENERLKSALNFYADISKYPAPLTGGLGELYYDCGQIARVALDGLPR